MPTGRTNSAAVHIPGIGDLVIGGTANSQNLSTVELLETTQMGDRSVLVRREINPMIEPKISPMAVYIEETVYVMGWNGDAEMLSFLYGQPSQWTQLLNQRRPMNLIASSMCVFNGNMFISGKLHFDILFEKFDIFKAFLMIVYM